MKDPKRRRYGAIVDRGQIAMPAQARRDHGSEVGKKLFVLGGLHYGLPIQKVENFIARDAWVEQILERECRS